MGIVFSLIRTASFEYYLINQKNSLTAKDQIRKMTIRKKLDPDDESRGTLRYVFADETRLPVPSWT
jgi:hypothetical protein